MAAVEEVEVIENKVVRRLAVGSIAWLDDLRVIAEQVESRQDPAAEPSQSAE